MNTIDVVVTQKFAAPPERVYDAWLDPVSLGTWMMGPGIRDEQVLHMHVDARVGGKFSFLVLRNGMELDHVGTYRELSRPSRLVFTWGVGEEPGDDSVVTLEIRPDGEGSELTLTHRMAVKWSEYAERTKSGWTKILGSLAKAIG